MLVMAVELEKRRQRQKIIKLLSYQVLENWWMVQKDGEDRIQKDA